jgi:hypothetical protein
VQAADRKFPAMTIVVAKIVPTTAVVVIASSVISKGITKIGPIEFFLKMK